MVLHQGEEFSGIVVSKRDYKERDLLVKILTNRYGYKTFYIRGAKKRGFRLGAIILPFSHGRYLGSINDDGLSYLSTGKEIDQYQNIFNDIMLNAYASYVLGLGEAAIKDDCILASQWYRKVERALQLIDQGVNPLIIVSIMEIQMLELFGVAPEWRFCAVCGNQRSSFDYSESYGGILCKNHWHLDQNRLHLDEKTMYFLRYLSDIDLDVLESVNLSEKTSIKIKRALDVIYDDQVGLYVPAKKFLNEMTSFDFAFEKGLDKTE